MRLNIMLIVWSQEIILRNSVMRIRFCSGGTKHMLEVDSLNQAFRSHILLKHYWVLLWKRACSKFSFTNSTYILISSLCAQLSTMQDSPVMYRCCALSYQTYNRSAKILLSLFLLPWTVIVKNQILFLAFFFCLFEKNSDSDLFPKDAHTDIISPQSLREGKWIIILFLFSSVSFVSRWPQ